MEVQELFSLHNEVVLVTGASSGIGLHLARTCAEAGAAVALAARRKDRVDTAAAELRDAGFRALGVSLDVANKDSIPTAFDTITEHFGAPSVLINNAGILHAEAFVSHSDEDLDRVIDTNFKGAFRIAQEAARRMIDNKRGSIVNVASVAGLRTGSSMGSYGASKAALISASNVMSLELARYGIRVNVICPGNIETDMQAVFTEKGFQEPMIKRTPMRRIGQLGDLDGAFLLCASDAGRYMTGAVITVDGGQTLSWM